MYVLGFSDSYLQNGKVTPRDMAFPDSMLPFAVFHVLCTRSALYVEYKPSGFVQNNSDTESNSNFSHDQRIYEKYLSQCLVQGGCSENLSLGIGEELVKV